MDALHEGYADSAKKPTTRARKRLQEWASYYRFDPNMEAAAVLKTQDPAAFNSLGTQTRIALGYYLMAKDAHDQLARLAAEEGGTE